MRFRRWGRRPWQTIERACVVAEDGCRVLGGMPGDELLCECKPVRVIGAQAQHGPITAPQQPLRAETGEQVRDVRLQRVHASAARGFGQQAGEFAMHIGMLRQNSHAGSPGDELASGNLRLATVIDHHAQPRMALQARLQCRYMRGADQGVKGQIVRK